MDQLIIKSKIRDFKVQFVDDTSFVKDLLTIPHYAVFTGSQVYKYYREKIFDLFPREKIIVMKLGEERKTINTAINLYKALMVREGKKSLTLISFGGGINQDISGFVASTLYRGINWIYVPTTLLAMADSSIGLKTSLNFASYKNMLGSFYPPTEVYIDVNFLKTLKKKDYASGVGEIMKLLLMDKNSLENLLKIIVKVEVLNKQEDKIKMIEIIKDAMQIKLSYMEGDEFDRGRRNLLNYGHELGHALEPVSKYQIPHGTAVVIGMIFANFISLQRGWLEKETFHHLNDSLFLPHIFGSMVKLKKEYFTEDAILKNIKEDKKRISTGLALILPQKNFKLCKIQDMSVDEFRRGLREVSNLLKA